MLARRKLLIFFSIIIVAIGTLLFIMINRNIAPGNKMERLTNKASEKVRSQLDEGTEEVGLNGSDEQKQSGKTLEASNCTGMQTAQAKDICFEDVASLTLDSGLCQQINDKTEQRFCIDQVAFKKAEKETDFSLCQEISTPELQNTCVRLVIEKDYTSVDCLLFGNKEVANYCLSEKNYQAAKAGKNAKTCLEIPNPYIRANCLSEIEGVSLYSDDDHDGLDFLQEIISGTNPKKDDTDGDGFKDGDEVKKKYDPLGQGKIIELTAMPCANLPNKQAREACLTEFPEKYLDLRVCSRVKDLNLKGDCYFYSRNAK